MHRYKLGRVLGEGAFGQVQGALHEESGEEVAIKTLKEKCKNMNIMMALPEVKALRALSHENIVKCKELILDRKGYVHMVFELLKGGNLESLARQRTRPFSEGQIRDIFYQLLLATRHMHSLSFLHRDIKPENILLQSSSIEDGVHIKVADLGLAKRCMPASARPHTAYVATRWYRSPEILLRISNYSFPSDMWAIGAVMAELINLGEPLFPGEDENDQLARIVGLRGHPSMVGWKTGDAAMKRRRIKLPRMTPSSLRTAIPRANLPVLQLISDLLELDPSRRPSAAEALEYPLFVVETPPSSDQHLHVRKRLKALSTERETARSRGDPSSLWSSASEEYRHDHVSAPKGRSSVRLGATYDVDQRGHMTEIGSAVAASPTPFNIRQVPRNSRMPSADVDTASGLRSPAGHFDMRLVN